ncbi:hypothetical protein ACBJ59_10950 [Nonomuraea sp. MTCD27]|uniref:hypothetical protein n=1 Tax=Nonomuraea sp. MTCD27 TaxID=1676747 RepID=UPI0035C12B4C
MSDTAAVDHEQALAAALHREVGRLEPRDCLNDILTVAHGRNWLCLWILAATVGLLLLAIGLYLAATYQPEPAPTTVHLTRLLEA